MDLKLNMPGLSGNVEKDLKNLNSYVFQLTEELRYLLNNLDVTNFNDLGLMRYENGRLQIYTDKLQAAVNEIEFNIGNEKDGLSAQIKAEADALKLSFQNAEQNLQALYTASADGLSGQITEKLGGVDEKMVQWQATVDGFSATVTEKLNGVDTKMSTWQHDIDGFRSEVSTVETNLDDFMTYANSVMMQNARQISLVVQETDGEYVLNTASIVAGIEEDESFIDLVADTIDLVGITRFYSDSGDDIDDEDFCAVEINDGVIGFMRYMGDSGRLSRDGELWLDNDSECLVLSADNCGISISTPYVIKQQGVCFVFQFPDGSYYELTQDGLDFYERVE